MFVLVDEEAFAGKGCLLPYVVTYVGVRSHIIFAKQGRLHGVQMFAAAQARREGPSTADWQPFGGKFNPTSRH